MKAQLIGLRKFLLAETAVLCAFVLCILGKLTGEQYLAAAGVVVAAYLVVRMVKKDEKGTP